MHRLRWLRRSAWTKTRRKASHAQFLQGCALVLAYKKPAPTVVDAKEEGKKKTSAGRCAFVLKGMQAPAPLPIFQKRRN